VAASKRTPFQRERDLVTVERLYLKQWSQQEIADKLELSRQQISYDLKDIRTRWREGTVRDLDEAKGKELGRLDELERVAWEAWERSVGETKTITHQIREKGEADKVVHERQDTERIEDLTGDPRYLGIIALCIKQRVAILGLEAPKKAELAGPGGGPVPTSGVLIVPGMAKDRKRWQEQVRAARKQLERRSPWRR